MQLLNEAYGKERQLEFSLESHRAMTTRADYEKRLRQHLKETKSHASTVAKRIKQLGGTAETVSPPGPDVGTKAAQSLQGAVGKAKSGRGAGPDLTAKGSGEQGKMPNNARAEYREEVEEIATYTVIDALATSVGTSRPQSSLATSSGAADGQDRGEPLPQLATDVAHDEIPVSEIKGDADRRRSTSSGATRRTPRKKASGNSTKSKSRKTTSSAKRS